MHNFVVEEYVYNYSMYKAIFVLEIDIFEPVWGYVKP